MRMGKDWNKEDLTLRIIVESVTVFLIVFSGTYGFWSLTQMPVAPQV